MTLLIISFVSLSKDEIISFNDELEIYKVTDKRLLSKIAKHQKPPQIDNAVRKKYNFLINYFDKDRLKIVEPEKAIKELF